MRYKNALCGSLIRLRWAFSLVAASFIAIIISCSFFAKENAQVSDDKMCLEDHSLGLDEELYEASFRCRGNTRDVPVLYAHYLAWEVSREEICSEDFFTQAHGTLHCAPGLASLAPAGVHVPEKKWLLKGLPDYFAWHLDNKSGVDEMIYIASPNGFPIKSQSIKLENEQKRTLVLFPKTSLSPNVTYYLYLIRTTATGTERWIQPLMMTASN